MENGKVNWQKVSVKQVGDRGEVVINGQTATNLAMRKINDKWYCEPAIEKPADLTKQVQINATIIRGYEAFERKVKAGAVTRENAREEMFKSMAEAKPTP